MKKNISVLFCCVMLLTMLTGCGRSSRNDVDTGNTERPGVNDSVVNDKDGMVGDDGIADPTVTDDSIMDDIENGIDNAGDAVQQGMDNVGDAVEDMTGR